MAEKRGFVIGGVDTHKDRHCAVAIDSVGTELGCRFFTTTRKGYAELIVWLESFGEISALGIEGSGGYGAGLCAYAQDQGLPVIEVSWPDKAERRRRGKTTRWMPTTLPSRYSQDVHTTLRRIAKGKWKACAL